jgi:hypothetical protein
MLRSITDWDKLRTDFESLHKLAEEILPDFVLEIVDDQCPHCGFRPCVQMKEKSRLKKPRRDPKLLAMGRQGKLFND